ncbi:heme lyase CcmF/NrfE family subunit [Thiohalorhabdus sp. Cl-TMA]|uniref:Heme lyase CcmF/NrfE family subunit n=1 Tax=Thiohalorhabdus methylotrophus TaxID=3242694 RepID=A0ABV4TU57_9GAMM
MIPELGNIALILALCMALVQSAFPLLGAARGVPEWMAVARPAAAAQFGFLAAAFAALAYCFAVSDFSVAFVAQNSNEALPIYYRLTAIWGGHEGSILLWTFILGVWTVAVAAFSRTLPTDFSARVLGIMGLVSIGFLLFMLFTSNPFARLTPVPPDGADLNPLLQDIGMIIHPPVLYVGYVGMAVAFGFAIAALLGGRLDAAWARWTRPWVGVAWVFLTLGVAIGSWWAYYELGWGGWWFWDPVENASFMPWLVGTALIHSLAVTEKRGVFKSWTVLLAITAFSLSLLGTFLVRSGVLTSVHAFATDPTRGVYILGFLTVVVGGSLLLYALRGPGTLDSGTRFSTVSRETLLLANNILLVVAMATILLGTLYPLVIEALGAGKLSVGPPYFNAVFVPIMSVLMVLLGVGNLSRWKRDGAARLWQQLRYVLVGSLVVGLGAAAMVTRAGDYIMVALGLVLAAWVTATSVQAVWSQLSDKRGLLEGLRRLPAGTYGMALAHLGLAVTVVGITITSVHNTETRLRMEPGETTQMAGYTFRFQGVERTQGPNYEAALGTIVVMQDGEAEAVLHPEKRRYLSGSKPMTEAGIDPGLTRDIYASLGQPMGDGGAWSVRLYHKPFVRWIWLGALFMAAGGVVALTDRRYRVARRRETASKAERESLAAATGEG